MNNWLFLRGEWDKNNAENIKNDTDMWCQLFGELARQDTGNIWFKGKGYLTTQKINAWSPEFDFKKTTHIFARGGFGYFDSIIKKCENAYKIYYGAGSRYLPEKGIHYDLILVDTPTQRKGVLKKYPDTRCELWVKPAARHFKPVDVKKEYDVAFVADCHSKYQENFKRVKWVYKTVPKDLKMLHLGKSSIKPPKNVTVRKVSRLKMPEMYSKCHTSIIPYKGKDSCPRVVSESMACNVRPFILDSVQSPTYGLTKLSKNEIWFAISRFIEIFKDRSDNEVAKYYQENYSLEKAVAHLKGLINDR